MRITDSGISSQILDKNRIYAQYIRTAHAYGRPIHTEFLFTLGCFGEDSERIADVLNSRPTTLVFYKSAELDGTPSKINNMKRFVWNVMFAFTAKGKLCLTCKHCYLNCAESDALIISNTDWKVTLDYGRKPVTRLLVYEVHKK